MLLHIIARGKIGRCPEADLVERYLKRVTWPTKNRAINICILVVSFVLVSAAFIAGLDFAFNKGYSYLLTLAGR